MKGGDSALLAATPFVAVMVLAASARLWPVRLEGRPEKEERSSLSSDDPASDGSDCKQGHIGTGVE